MSKKTIALTWGSTWGHIFPLVSLYNYLKEDEGYEFMWFWEEGQIEEDIAREAWIDFHDISAWKLRRYLDYRNLYEPLKNLTWIVEALYYIKKYNIDIVFSKWGYVSLPMAIASKIMWKKLYVHESDTVGGISNKIVSKLADKVFYSFENNKVDDIKCIHSGQILNPELLDGINTLAIAENPRMRVLVTGWSQWSKSIFESLLEVLPSLNFIDFTIILWEKNASFKEDFEKYTNVKTYDFISQKEFGQILKTTDIALTRAWATSLWEQNMFWIHSIIVPLTHSAWNHQMSNADYFNEKFWSDILLDDEFLSDNIKNKLNRYKDLRKSGLNLDKFFDALKIIKANIK